MKLHKIADLNVLIDYRHDILKNQAPAYEINEPGVVDIAIDISDDFLNKQLPNYPGLTIDQCEYLFTGAYFYNKLIDFGGIYIHSSAVEYEGYAYLFSAPSGTGKSTHAGMWKKVFGDGARIINDDKPAVRIIGKTAYAYGTPWSGKTNLNINAKVPIAGICYIYQSRENVIERLDIPTSAARILEQTLRPADKGKMSMVLDAADRFISSVPVYSMGCNISEDAVYMAYNTMKRR